MNGEIPHNGLWMELRSILIYYDNQRYLVAIMHFFHSYMFPQLIIFDLQRIFTQYDMISSFEG